MLNSIINYFYPGIPAEETKKFKLLSLTLFLLIGTYWMMRLFKKVIFYKLAYPVALGWSAKMGASMEPKAKMYSIIVVFVLVVLYSKIVNKVRRYQLIYILCGIYSAIFAAIGFFLLYVDMAGFEAVGKLPLQIMGWSSYFLIESFGSLVIALFWSFSNSINDTDSARVGFPLIGSAAALGAILGSASLKFSSKPWPIILVGAFAILLSILVIRYLVSITPQDKLVDKQDVKTEKEGFFKGFFSGLTLLFSRPYLLGILVIATFYELAAQIVEYQMNNLAADYYPTSAEFQYFQSNYGQLVNLTSFLISLLGLSYILRQLGTKIALLIYPISFGIILFALFIYNNFCGKPELGHLMWATTISMIVIKGIAYAVNNPTKEIMYIPTSKDAKFKTKQFIDSFAARLAKGEGAGINKIIGVNNIPYWGYISALAVIAVWGVVAFWLGRRNEKLVASNQIIE